MLDGRTVFTVLLILYALGLLFGKPSQYKMMTALFTVGLAFVAFHARSIYDLNNYYAAQGYKSSLSLLEFLDVQRGHSETGAQLWMWMWSKFRYLGVLPAMTAAAFYSGVLGALLAVWRRLEAKREYFFLAAVFVLCTTKYYSVLAGIRNHMGFMIFAVAFMAEMLLKKDWRLCWAGYFIALSFHSSILVLFMLRLFLEIYRRYPNQLLMGFLFVASAFGYPMLEFAAQITGSEYLQRVADKTETYYGGEGEEGQGLSLGNVSTAWVKIACIALLLLYAYALWRKGRLSEEYKSYADFVTACLFLTIGASGSQHTLVRFPELLGLLAAPLLMAVLTAGEKVQIEKRSRTTCIRRRHPQYPVAMYWLFLLDSGMFIAFQFMGTLTLIGWQTPALLVGSIG